MAVLQQTLTPPRSELDALRSAMRDVQVSIGDYHRETSGTSDPDALATRVRTCVAFIQVVNELLRNSGVHRDYRAMFKPPEDPRIGVIQAFEYVRHLMQHVLHPVRPYPSSLIGGYALGLRTYASWETVPRSAHDRLKASTQQLSPYYDQYLSGHEVTGTFLNAAQFFHDVCPDVVHRDAGGEWTGFPLDHQPGVADRLHPEEPHDHASASLWMVQRRPGGDRRVISGTMGIEDGRSVVFGFTFAGNCAFVPFFETVEQVNTDIALGYLYSVGDVAGHTTQRANVNVPGSRSLLCSDTDFGQWAGEALHAAPLLAEHSTFLDVEWWRKLWILESSTDLQSFLTRRERRLCAATHSADW